jgi:hydroxymethylpyrimidine pyrophosphatase-like HAD family hydrolase
MSVERFPLPEESLVLFDIDGTLIDHGYNITDPEIRVTVQDAQDAGWTLGLSSDTPYESMIRYRDMLNMNGPIIAEKGAIIEWDDKLNYDEEESQLFQTAFAAMRQHFVDRDITIWEGNPVLAILDKLSIGSAGDTVVLMNNLRKCSLGIFVRYINGTGDMVTDTKLTHALVNEVRYLFPSLPDLSEDLNDHHGLLILANENANKRRGSQKLLSLAQMSGRFAMVGNSIADYVGDDIAVHYAVSDATLEFRKRADFIADQPITVGAVQILRKLIEASSV